MVTLADFHRFFLELSKLYESQTAYLTELDSVIGDADHGLNLNRGFRKVAEEIEKTPPVNPEDLLKQVAMQLIKNVGGASGPLLGTFFLKASQSVKGMEQLDAPALAKLFRDGSQGVVALGKAEIGDKTMIDTLLPAVEAMEAYQNTPIAEMLDRSREAAEAGMKSTIDLVAKKGRASYLGERSRGHQDPGATSSYLLIELASRLFS